MVSWKDVFPFLNERSIPALVTRLSRMDDATSLYFFGIAIGSDIIHVTVKEILVHQGDDVMIRENVSKPEVLGLIPGGDMHLFGTKKW